MNDLAIPKSIRYTLWASLFRPMQKFDGFMSLCIYPLPCKSSKIRVIYLPNKAVVLRENLPPHSLRSSSKFDPRSSMTSMVNSSFWPNQSILGIPSMPYSAFITRLSLSSWGYRAPFRSILITTLLKFPAKSKSSPSHISENLASLFIFLKTFHLLFITIPVGCGISFSWGLMSILELFSVF